MQKRIGIFINAQSEDALRGAQQVRELARQYGFACAPDAQWSVQSDSTDCAVVSESPDFIFALGGDGTILRAVRAALLLDVPVLGVNFGRVGFLSEINMDELETAFRAIAQEGYTLDERSTLECRVNGGAPHLCVNEALLYKRRFSGVVDINVNIDGKDAGSVFCDGIIVSTPTGATGYSISAGGPVIAPGLEAAIITPICAHTLTFRPIVAAMDAKMRFSMQSDGYLAVDGSHTQDISTDDRITICRGKRNAKFIRLRERNLYELIRSKLV